MAWTARAVASGMELYSDWRLWPHRIMPHGPLLCFPIGKTFGIVGISDIGFHVHLAGRLQSILNCLATFLLLGRVLAAAGWRSLWAFRFPVIYFTLWIAIMIPHPSYESHALSDPLSYSLLTNKGWIDKGILQRKIEGQQFSHIVFGPTSRFLFNSEHHSKWIGDLVRTHYHRREVLPEYEIWVPKAAEAGIDTPASIE